MDRALVDEGIELVKEQLIPAFLQNDGALHGYWMADRGSGRVLTITCWENRTCLDAGMSADSEMRAAIADRLRALSLGSEIHEVHGKEGVAAPMTGAHAFSRLVWVEGLPADIQAQDLFQATYEKHQSKPGFQSVCWMLDRMTGNGVGMTTWDSHDDLTRDEQSADNKQLRREVTAALGCQVDNVELYETVAASVDRVVDLTAAAKQRSDVAAS